MKYHSRSPEEWKKIDEEKMKMSRTSELRKRSLMFLFVNFILVVAVILMVRIYQVMSPTSQGTVGPFKVFISVEDEFLEGEKVKAQVKIVNTRKSKQSLKLEDFTFFVKDENGEVEYSFEHKGGVSTEVDPLSYVLVFDLSREVDLSLKPGIHRIVTSMEINGVKTTAVRTFKVVEKLEMSLVGYQPFLFLGERLKLDVGITNPTSVSKKIKVKSVKIKVLSESGKKLDSKVFKIEDSFEIQPKQAVRISTYSPNLVFDTLGLFQIDVEMEYDSKVLKEKRSFKVITKDQIGLKGIRFYVEVPIQVISGHPFDLKVSLYNDTKEDRYVEVNSFLVSITGKDTVITDESNDFRVWIPPHSKEEIYSKDGIIFRYPGKYELLILLRTPKGDMSKKIEIIAGGV